MVLFWKSIEGRIALSIINSIDQNVDIIKKREQISPAPLDKIDFNLKL